MRLLQKSLTAALISCAFSAGWAANTIAPQNGNWIVSDELTGKPGRGMGIDVQDGVFVMQVYNYNKDGTATFHMATGKMEDNKVIAPLKQYKDGPFFGSGARNGVEAADAGDVEIEFTSRTTASIKFPGEEAKVMHRFNYENPAVDTWADPQYVERWAMVELDDDGKPVNTFWADMGEGAQMALSPDMNPGWPYADSKQITVHSHDLSNLNQFGFMECGYTGAGHMFSCQGEQINVRGGGATRQPMELQIQRSLDQLQGTVTNGTDGKPRRIIGARVEKTAYEMVGNQLTTTEYFRRNSLPEAGTWIVSSEITGQAGRGISLDVQKPAQSKHLLFMPIYNYESSGNASFHIATGTHSPSVTPDPETPSLRLMRYKGGRYFGGPAQDGQDDLYVGPVSISFGTSATGVIQFPKEDSVRIQRYYFGVNQESVDSLVGSWALLPHNGVLKHRVLNLVKTAPGLVEDKEAGYSCTVNYWLGFRFVCDAKTIGSDLPRIRIATGWYGAARAITGDGGPLLNSTNELTVMRVLDGEGNEVQGGAMYPAAESTENPGSTDDTATPDDAESPESEASSKP